MALMHRFFTAPKTWLLQVEREPGVLDFALEVQPEGKALVCFLSPVDAHIEGLMRAKPGMRYYVNDAWAAHETWFLREPGLLMAFLHLAWVSQSGRMLSRPSGAPCRYFRPLHKSVEGDGPFTFDVDVVGGDLAFPEPTFDEVLLCLVQDAGARHFESFEAWAAEHGYDSDSRKAEAVYRACMECAKALLKLFAGETELQRISALMDEIENDTNETAADNSRDLDPM